MRCHLVVPRPPNNAKEVCLAIVEEIADESPALPTQPNRTLPNVVLAAQLVTAVVKVSPLVTATSLLEVADL
jgi:hypothetical protein